LAVQQAPARAELIRWEADADALEEPLRFTTTLPAISVLTLSFLIGVPSGGFAQDRRAEATGGRDAITVVACVVREADYVRSTAPEATAAAGTQLLLANAQSGAPTYSLTGIREEELTQQVGQRVEISGTVEPARTTPILTTADGNRTGSVKTEGPGAAGITPEGAAAHEPSDAVATTVQAGKVNPPANKVSDPAYQVATLPRLNASSFRRVAGTCATPPTERTASVTPAASQVTTARPSPSPATSQTVTARGCLVRQTQDGTALTPQSTGLDSLVLSKASMADSRPSAVVSAVPGSAPSGSGSGTVPNAVATTGATPDDNGSLSFRLATAPGKAGELTQHVGERVEVVGTIDEEPRPVAEAAGASAGGREQPAAPKVAHPSAPARLITVTTFRAVGGACN
jgi:hypothetical protein